MSCRLIDSGTPQDGWKITCSRSCENTGVGVSGLPTITRSVWMTFPSLTTRSVNSGTLTQTYKSPSWSGIQRHCSMFTASLRRLGVSGAADCFLPAFLLTSAGATSACATGWPRFTARYF